MAELTIQKGQDIPDNKYLKAIADTQVCTDDAQVAAAVQKIIDDHYQENCTNEVYEFLLNCVDLTTLSTTDSEGESCYQSLEDEALIEAVYEAYLKQTGGA